MKEKENIQNIQSNLINFNTIALKKKSPGGADVCWDKMGIARMIRNSDVNYIFKGLGTLLCTSVLYVVAVLSFLSCHPTAVLQWIFFGLCLRRLFFLH